MCYNKNGDNIKKVIYILVVFIWMISPKVYALGECKDYLEYVTTKDTIAYTNGVQTYDIKEGTEFKMCFQEGSDAIIRLNEETIINNTSSDKSKTNTKYTVIITILSVLTNLSNGIFNSN